MFAIFHLLVKIPCLTDVLIIAVIVGSTVWRMVFRSDVGTGSSSHDLVESVLMIDLILSSVTPLKEFNFGMLDGDGLYSRLLSSSCLIFLIFPMKRSANPFATVSSSSCLGSGLFGVVPVKCLTSEYNFLALFPHSAISLPNVSCLVVLSRIFYFSHSTWSAIQWWCCLYFLHVFSLFLTNCFCHFTLSEYHGFFGLVTIVLDIVGACLFSALFSVVSYRSTIWLTSSICDIIVLKI